LQVFWSPEHQQRSWYSSSMSQTAKIRVFYGVHHGDGNADPKNRVESNNKHINTKYYMCWTVIQSYMAIGHVPAPPYRLKKGTHFREISSVPRRCWSHHCHRTSTLLLLLFFTTFLVSFFELVSKLLLSSTEVLLHVKNEEAGETQVHTAG
jgi:hypothetical protein